jgi:hypothetical protein
VSDMPPGSAGPTPPPPPTSLPMLPWEEPNAGLGSLGTTLGRFITRPIESFGLMSPTVDLVRPLAFYVVLLLFGAIVSQIWNQLFWSSSIGMLKRLLEATGQGALFEQFQPQLARPHAFQIVLGLIVTPLFYLVILFVWTAVVHGLLLLVGGAGGGFATTLRVMCYSGTAWTAVLIPFVGSVLAFVWFLVLAWIGLTSAQRTEGWKAAMAILLPLLLCCLCCIGGAAAFGAALVQAIQQHA